MSCAQLHIELLKMKEKLKSIEHLVQSQREIIVKQRIENNQLRKENKKLAENQSHKMLVRIEI